jgi:hypothetical protein
MHDGAAGHTPEVMQRELHVLREPKVLLDAAVVPAGHAARSELKVADVLVRLRIAELNVRVEVDVIAAPHLPGIVDVELRRPRRQLNACQREPARILVQSERRRTARQRRPRWIVRDVVLVGTLEVVRAPALQSRDRRRIALDSAPTDPARDLVHPFHIPQPPVHTPGHRAARQQLLESAPVVEPAVRVRHRRADVRLPRAELLLKAEDRVRRRRLHGDLVAHDIRRVERPRVLTRSERRERPDRQSILEPARHLRRRQDRRVRGRVHVVA